MRRPEGRIIDAKNPARIAANKSNAITVTTSPLFLASFSRTKSPRPELDIRPLRVDGNDSMPVLKLSARATDVAQEGTNPIRAETTGCHSPVWDKAPETRPLATCPMKPNMADKIKTMVEVLIALYNAWDAISIGPDLPLAQLHPQPGLCPWVPGLRAFPKFDLTRDLFICKVATLVQIPATVPQTSLVASKGSTHGKEARSESITGIASSEVEIKVASNEPIGIIPSRNNVVATTEKPHCGIRPRAEAATGPMKGWEKALVIRDDAELLDTVSTRRKTKNSKGNMTPV